jgi:hypothetical protein
VSYKEPVYPNFEAVNVKGEYSVMPDISLSGQPVGGDTGAGCNSVTLAAAVMFLLSAVLLKTFKYQKK